MQGVDDLEYQETYPKTTYKSARLRPSDMVADNGHQLAPSYGGPLDNARPGGKKDHGRTLGVNVTLQKMAARNPAVELHRTCQPLRYPASWNPSSSCALRLLPSVHVGLYALSMSVMCVHSHLVAHDARR